MIGTGIKVLIEIGFRVMGHAWVAATNEARTFFGLLELDLTRTAPSNT